MKEIDCEVCEDLASYATDLVSNGEVTEKVCTSIANDTGLNPDLPVLHTDCEDLEDLNDCLIGRPEQDLERYDNCEWRKFMRKYISNLHTFNKAVLCALCGIWKNIHNLWKKINEILQDLLDIHNELDLHDCQISALMEPQELQFNEGEFIAGTDVAFRQNSNSIGVSFDVIGNMGVLNASVQFTSGSKWLTELGVTTPGDEGWLVAELRINKARTGIKHIYAAGGQTINDGCYLASVYGFDGDQDSTQYGRAKRGIYSNKTPSQWGWQDGSVNVPAGWIYLQLRVSNILAFHGGVSFFANLVVVRDTEILCGD